MNVKISAFNQGKFNLENQFCIFGRKRKCNDDRLLYSYKKNSNTVYQKNIACILIWREYYCNFKSLICDILYMPQKHADFRFVIL